MIVEEGFQNKLKLAMNAFSEEDNRECKKVVLAEELARGTKSKYIFYFLLKVRKVEAS